MANGSPRRYRSVNKYNIYNSFIVKFRTFQLQFELSSAIRLTLSNSHGK